MVKFEPFVARNEYGQQQVEIHAAARHWGGPNRPVRIRQLARIHFIFNRIGTILRISYYLLVAPNEDADNVVDEAADVEQPVQPEWMQMDQSVHRCYMLEQTVASTLREPFFYNELYTYSYIV